MCVVGLVACGGSDGDSDGGSSPGVATIGAAGGTVALPDGTQVVFPAGALKAGVTVRIARDGTGAPPLPDIALPAGAVYVITPHGGDFGAPVQVSVPVERSNIAANEQLVLLTAEPGDTRWRVLSAARYDGAKLHAPVAHFSWFQAAVIVDRWIPTLVSTIENKNNVGGPGIVRIAPQDKIGGDEKNVWSPNDPALTSRISARLSWPDPRYLGVLASQSSVVACKPVRIGHDGSEWRWVRNGSETLLPQVRHQPLSKSTVRWPRDPSEWLVVDPTYGPYDSMDRYSPGGMRQGMGAVHYFGNETPTFGGWHDDGPFERLWHYAVRDFVDEGDPYPLPPTGDRVGDNLLTWEGQVVWRNWAAGGGFTTPNGAVRVDVAVLSDCGLLIEAAPLYFVLELPSDVVFVDFFGRVFAPPGPVTMVAGAPAGLRFRGDQFVNWSTVVFEFSRTPMMPASWTRIDATRIADSTVQYPDLAELGYARTVQFASASADDAGFYRARFCTFVPNGGTGACLSTELAQVIVLTAPPTVASSPRAITVVQGETASFTIATSGAPLPSLQWQRRANAAAPWADIAGATAATYTTPPTTLADAGSEFRAVLSNVAGSITSGAAVLTVVERFVAPAVTGQPTSLAVPVGGTAVFAATVSGTAPLSYQWRRNEVAITGANSAILILDAVTGANEGSYDLQVSNRAGNVTSQPAILSVVVGDGQVQPVAIAASPVGLFVAQGNSASFAVSVTGSGPFAYQWLKNGTAIAGATGPAHTIASAVPADAGSYSVRVTNVAGSATSAAATLTIGASQAAAPQIATGPTSLSVLPGAGATFAVAASGSGPLSYQWRRDGIDVPGANDAVLHLAAVTVGHAGAYSVVVANSLGSVASGSAQLVVVGAPGIVSQPSAMSAAEAATATFSVSAIGTGLRYQWLRDRVAIGGATAASYTTPRLTSADDGSRYSVLVYNGAGAIFSQEATLNVSPSPPPKSWSAASLIAGGGYMLDPAAGVDGNGRSLAVWTNYPPSGTAGRVQFSAGTAAGWSAPAIIDSGFVYGYETRLAVAGNGRAIAAWGSYVGGAYRIAAAHFDGTNWAAAARVDTSQASNSTDHALAMDAQGRGVLAWAQPVAGNYRVHASISSGGLWSAPVVFERGAIGGLPAVAVNGDGRGFVVFNETSDTVVAAPVDAGVGFGAPVVIRAKGRPVGRVHVNVDALGNALAVWIDGTVDGDRLRYARFTPAGGWGAPEDVAAIGWPPDHQLSFAGSLNGDAAVAWVANESGRTVVYLQRYSTASGWGVAERISAASRYGDSPQLAMNASGHLVVIWTQTDAATDSIYQVWGRVNDGVWRDAKLLPSSAFDVDVTAQRGVGIGPTGTATALWVENAADGTEPLLGAFWP